MDNRIDDDGMVVGGALVSAPYSPFFTDTVIKARSRLVDTSTEEWDIGEINAELLNFNLIDTDNAELLDQVKYVTAWFVKNRSPGHSFSIFRAVKSFLNSCESFDDEVGDELTEAFTDEVLYYFASNRQDHDEDDLQRVRLWYQRGAKLKMPLFKVAVGNALGQLKLHGRVKGLDILVDIPGKSPLSSNMLTDLRKLLNQYREQFVVGQPSYWRMAAIWVFITLGIRPIQLRLLMLCDLAVNVDQKTKHKTYLLNVPSAKKRHEKPRTRFKSRPIPAFLGEMLESLKEFNLKWLDENGLSYHEDEVPLFFPRPTEKADLRKEGARLELFKWTFARDSVTASTQHLINELNELQKKSRKPTFDEPITPRRLRKTFATHAAACGTPAMVLMELLDHEDMQHVMIYYKLGANFALKIDQVYREQFGTMFDYFEGKITLQEFSDANKSNQVYGPDNLRRLVAIGFCGKKGRCRKVPPYSCYTCAKFEACNDKQVHTEVFECMIEDIGQLFKNNVAPAKYEMDHINACRSLLDRLENS